LLRVLREKHASGIVTLRMPQAARPSDFTGFAYLGRRVEFADARKILANPAEKLAEDYIRGSFG
jgi:phosphate transport system ATP-binding protein